MADEDEQPSSEPEQQNETEAQLAEMRDRMLRALAEAENIRRRAEREKLEVSQYVIDGGDATERQLLATLERYGVKIIDTVDAKFDPKFHQAIAEVPGEGKPPGTIVNVVQTGYMIGERLLRPAMVTVARKEDGPVGGVDTKA